MELHIPIVNSQPPSHFWPCIGPCTTGQRMEAEVMWQGLLYSSCAHTRFGPSWDWEQWLSWCICKLFLKDIYLVLSKNCLATLPPCQIWSNCKAEFDLMLSCDKNRLSFAVWWSRKLFKIDFKLFYNVAYWETTDVYEDSRISGNWRYSLNTYNVKTWIR